MFMAFPASEWDVFIINGLDPIFILIFQDNGAWEGFGYVQVDTYACIGGVAPLLGGFR